MGGGKGGRPIMISRSWRLWAQLVARIPGLAWACACVSNVVDVDAVVCRSNAGDASTAGRPRVRETGRAGPAATSQTR